MPLSSQNPLRRFLDSVDGFRIPPQFWRPFFRRYLWIILGALLLLFGLKTGGAWIHQKWTARQSRQLAAEAETRLREGRATEARMALETALRLDPANTTALRSLATLQTSEGRFPEALKTWQKIVDAGALTFADLPTYARVAAETQDWEITKRLVDATKAGKSPSLPHLLQAELSSIRGDLDDAERSLRAANSLDDGRETRSALARFLLVHKNTSENSAEILALLRELYLDQGELGALALASALENNLVPEQETSRWITNLNRHPKATPAMLLVAESARIRLDPDSRPIVAAKVFSRLGNESLDSRAAGVQWLLAAKEPALAARLVTRSEALSRPDLLVKWLDALSASGRREEILEVLADPANPLPPVQSRLYEANTLKLLGRTAESDALNRQVLSEHSSNPAATLKILTYLYLAGENTLFENELRALLAQPDTARQSMQALLPVVQSLRDINQTRRLHELAIASGGLSNTIQLRNEIDYSDLLLGRPVEPRALELLARRNPDNLPLRLTWAMFLLTDGQTPRALVEMQSCSKIHTVNAALFARREMLLAAALAANGHRREALKIQARLPWKHLTLQESTFLLQTQSRPANGAAAPIENIR
ncbi:MAG: tetratricopeptide repeat protein [Verrucomicrobiota bacterium]